MRNKNLLWFITIMILVISIYQLSFSFITSSEESKAEKKAKIFAEELKTESLKNGGGLVELPGTKTKVDFKNPDALELAISAFTNKILREKSEKSVYMGNTFKEVKAKSLAFGLDLVGGMSVALEMSVPETVLSFSIDRENLFFKKPFDEALGTYNSTGGDFIQLFVSKYESKNPNRRLVQDINLSDMDGKLSTKSTNADVAAFMREKVATSMDGVEQIMSKRINQFGLSQPNIQKDLGRSRLYIELPGVKDQATVTEQIQKTANLEFFETIDRTQIASALNQADVLSKYEMEAPAILSVDTTKGKDSMSKAVENKTAIVGKKSVLQMLTPVPGAGEALVGQVKVSEWDDLKALLRRSDIKAVFAEVAGGECVLMPDATTVTEKGNEESYLIYAVKCPKLGAPVNGKDIDEAYATIDQKGNPAISLKMTTEGADKWASMTQDNTGRTVTITMDSIIYSAAMVRGPITGGNTEITGNYTIQETKDFAGLLNGGALPAPCVIKEQTVVGPTIGAENKASGFISFGIALLCVFLYMVFYYGKAGVIADIALIFNVIFIFGALASFGAVLTLSGMAGLVLTIGMAVDANVLIFERIREELALGKSDKESFDLGFEKALSSIIDANVTTLITAIVLKVFGTGPIESFATTLIIGLITSVFAAVVIGRLIMYYRLEKGQHTSFDTRFTRNAFKNIHIDFVKHRKKFYLVSGLLTVLGIVSLVARGLNPSVEFSGGRTYTYAFDKKVNEELVRTTLTNELKSSVEVKTRNGSYQLIISTNYLLNDSKSNNLVIEKLGSALGKIQSQVGSAKLLESRTVSAAVSEELKYSSFKSMAIALILIFVYILVRFGRWQYSTGAIIAMAHDVFLIITAFSLFYGILPINLDLDQAFIAALLTVIGYSINDTVIVFDRIRENLSIGHTSSGSNAELINEAMNSTLSRTINTSFTTALVLIVMFFLGGTAISGFIFALLVGVVVGTYSSVCIAVPLLIDLSPKKMLE
jgi:SecD/SecF fusion protein